MVDSSSASASDGVGGERVHWVLDPARSGVRPDTGDSAISRILGGGTGLESVTYHPQGGAETGAEPGDMRWWVRLVPEQSRHFPGNLGPLQFESGPAGGTAENPEFDGTVTVGKVRVRAHARGTVCKVTTVTQHATVPDAGPGGAAAQVPLRAARLMFTGTVTLRRDAVAAILTSASRPLSPLTLLVPMVGDLTVTVHVDYLRQP